MPIIITQDGENAKKVERSSFQSEDRLQKYIHANPESIPIYEIDEDIRLLILAREFATSSGPIDALGIDENGQVYLIETKLYKNSDKRLVVAQVLDYGAALAHDSNDFGEFVLSLEKHVQKGFDASLKDKVTDFFGLSDEEYAALLDKIEINLDRGEFSFVVLMDTIGDRLKNLIVFINQYSNFDIFGVELEYYKHNEFEVIIPKLFGTEVAKAVSKSSKSSRRGSWNDATFMEKLKERLNQDEIKIIKEVYDFSLRTSDKIKWGSGAVKGSFNPIYEKICPRSLFTIDTIGVLKINQHWMEETPQMIAYRDKLLEKMKAVLGLPDQPKVWGFYKEDWMPHKDGFTRVIQEVVSQ